MGTSLFKAHMEDTFLIGKLHKHLMGLESMISSSILLFKGKMCCLS